MRPVKLGQPAGNNDREWYRQALLEIERASQEETEAIADDFTPTNVTTTRAFDADTVTTAQLADVLGTLIQDLQQRGRR